jgi:hypothetical protein
MSLPQARTHASGRCGCCEPHLCTTRAAGTPASAAARQRLISSSLQRRFNGSITIVWMITPPILWSVGENACASYTLVWLGCLPILLCFTCLTIVQLRLFQPCIPTDGPPAPHAVLQQFAWTARGVPRTRARRATAVRGAVSQAALDAPVFCFETAIKAFFWSAVLYDYTEVEGHALSLLPAEMSQLMGGVAEAMALFDLREQRLFHDKELEIKVVVAWGDNKVLLCARGSKERANFVADAKVCAVRLCRMVVWGNALPNVSLWNHLVLACSPFRTSHLVVPTVQLLCRCFYDCAVCHADCAIRPSTAAQAQWPRAPRPSGLPRLLAQVECARACIGVRARCDDCARWRQRCRGHRTGRASRGRGAHLWPLPRRRDRVARGAGRGARVRRRR